MLYYFGRGQKVSLHWSPVPIFEFFVATRWSSLSFVVSQIFFRSVVGNFVLGLSTDRAWEVSAMTENNIASTDRKSSYYYICYQKVEGKKKQSQLKWLQFAMSSLCQGMASHYNDCVAFKKFVCKYFINKDVYFRFRGFCPSSFTNKATSFLTTGYTRKYRSVFEDF